MGKDTDELFSELTKAKTDKELKTFYERNEEELQHPDAVACLEQLFAKHKLKKADVILNTGLERTFAYHLLAGRKTFTRDKLLIFAIAAQLTIEETQTLLKYAGEGKLYARDARDGMVIHALNHKLDPEPQAGYMENKRTAPGNGPENHAEALLSARRKEW